MGKILHTKYAYTVTERLNSYNFEFRRFICWSIQRQLTKGVESSDSNRMFAKYRQAKLAFYSIYVNFPNLKFPTLSKYVFSDSIMTLFSTLIKVNKT